LGIVASLQKVDDRYLCSSCIANHKDKNIAGRSLSRLFKILLIGFGLFFEMYFVGTFQPYPHGEIFAVQYRNQERYSAWTNSAFHPSSTTKAVLQEEIRLMHKHEDWKWDLALGLLVVINAVGIYYFLKHE